MAKKISIRNWLFLSEKETDFNTRLFLLGAFIIAVSNWLGLINNVFLGLDARLILVNILFALTSTLLLIFVRKKAKANATSGIFLILISAVSLMIFWPLNAGFNGPMLLYFAILPIFLSLFLSRIKSYITLLSGLIIVGVFFWYYFLQPQLIVPYVSAFNQYADNYTSLIFVSWGLLEIGLFYREETRKVHEKLKEQVQVMEVQYNALKEVEEFKSTVFASLSHDIKSPIQNMSTLFEMLLDQEIPLEEKRKITQMASTQMAETSAYVENVFIWARSQMGGLNITKTAFNIAQVVQEVTETLKVQLTSKSLRVEQNIPEDLMAFGDRSFFVIVISNFVRNAIKFSNENGKISIIARPTTHKMIDIQVIDQGIGIADERIANLFNSNTSTRGTANEKGSGLGLRIAKLFTELNGGEVYVQSAPGVGSKFGTSIKER